MTPNLIERLETAEAGSRELDGAVYRVVCSNEKAMLFGGDVRTKEPARWGTVADLGPLSDYDVAEGCGAPHLTTSLDAAVALVREKLPGAQWMLSDTGKTHALATIIGHGAPVHAKTAPLAICAALLRAMAAVNVDETPDFKPGLNNNPTTQTETG